MADAAALVRAGSGLVFVLIGVALFALGRGARANVGLAVWATGFGSVFVITNLAASVASATVVLVLASVAWALAGAGLVLFATASRPSAREAVAATSFGSGIFVALLAAYFVTPPSDSVPAGLLVTVSLAWAVHAAVVVGLAVRARHDAHAAARWALLSVALGAYVAFSAGTALLGVEGGHAFGPLFGLLFLGGTVVAWLAAARAAGRPAFLVAWALLGAGVVGMTVEAWFGGSGVHGGSAAVGVLRTAAVGLLAYAVLRHRLLGFDLALPTVRRGTLATVALVGFFAVAQIAQEFLSDSMGVLVGGAAAGALLFAAVPLQRAAERMAGRAGDASAPAAAPAAEEAFRAALRLALHDGSITDTEETHLADVAERLRLGPAATLRLRRAVEAEYGHR